MKKYSFLLAVSLAVPFISSCVEGLFGDKDEDGKVDLTIRGPQTKAHLEDDIYVVWDEGDEVVINNMSYTVEPDAENPGSAIVRGVESSDSYLACYGSHLSDNGDYCTYYISSFQSPYVEGSFSNSANVMIAYSTSDKLQFHNLGGILKVGVTGNGETVKSVTLRGNNGEQLSGERKITKEDIEYGDFDNTVWYEENDYNQEINISFDGADVLLSQEPVWFYFALPPMTFSNGFAISIADMSGNIFSKSTNSSVTVSRSRITEVDNFVEFVPAEGLSLKVTGATHNSITYEISGEPNAVVNTGLVYSRFYEIMKMENGPGNEAEILDGLVLWYSEPVTLGNDGLAVHTVISADAIECVMHLASDTEYVLFAGYVSGETVANTFKTTASTSAASGAMPGLNVTQEELTFKSAAYRIQAPDAAYAYYTYMSKSEYDEALANGFTDDDLMHFWTPSVEPEALSEVNASGFVAHYPRSDMYPETDWILLVTVTSEGGQEESRKIEFTTPKYLPDGLEYELVSENAVFRYETDMYDGTSVAGLTLRKVVSDDIFLLENPFPGMGLPVNSDRFVVSDDASEWIIIDARNNNEVKMEKGVNRVGLKFKLAEDEYNIKPLFFASRIFGNFSDGNFGTYSPGEMEINLGDVCFCDDWNTNGLFYSAYIDWNPGSSSGGIVTEDFEKDPEIGSWK